MSCYRCGTRQVDPDRGESPWRRGVRDDRQVLICPGCQASADWMADLDRCPVCAGVRLVRRLGEAECRDCGAVRPAAAGEAPAAPGMTQSGMAQSGMAQSGMAQSGMMLPGHLAAVAAAGGGESAGRADRERAGPGDREPGPSGEVSDLSREVAAALDRVLGRA
jgi:hypothetical protein